MSGFQIGAESTLDQPAPATSVDATPIDRPILSPDPAQWMRNRQLLQAAAPKPLDVPEFRHGSRCKALGDPAWELRGADVRGGWRRKCGQCMQVQVWVPPRPPEPPRPSDELIAAWRHCDVGAASVELIIVRDASGLAIWKAACGMVDCRAVRWFGREAADHYAALGVDLRAEWVQGRGFELGASS